MFKSRILFSSTALITLLIGCSNTEQAPVDEASNNTSNDETEDFGETTRDYDGDGGYLWKVTNEETTFFMLGTIHLGNEDYYPLAAEIEEAYQSADIILPEVNMLEAEIDEETVTEMALFDDGTTLDQLLSEEAYADLVAIFEENGITTEDFNGYKPWFVESLLSDIVNEESKQSNLYGVDLHFLQRAVEDNKEIIELESIETQYEILAGFSLDLQIDNLERYIAVFDEQPGWLDELSYHWIHGNQDSSAEQLVTMVSEVLTGTDDEYSRIINDERNIDMANSIDKLLQQNSGQTYMAIVGTAHLVVEPAIPSELEKKGYEVVRVY
ncbi:TraB/GumN family protein [Shouchella miscanthi]|uniref:TraB/GumN family protein n=1 Tax=Shouchella miscanthi TaxID=2598861 RepID=A0ABU6NMB6_9BACI|nr:TraB/GumN family protein [Shouchella miscanthi]